MKRLIVFLMVISLIFLSVASNVFAVTYANVGPTTDFDGDVGVPAGSAYYINGVLLALTDITTEDLLDKAMLKPSQDWGEVSVSAAGDMEIDDDVITTDHFTHSIDWGEIKTIADGTLEIDADVIDIDNFVHSADLGDIKVNAGGTAIELDDDVVDIATFVASADLGEIAVNVGGDAIEIEDDVINIEHFVHSADMGEIVVNADGTALEIDEDVIVKANFADEDWGELTVSTNEVTIDDDVIGAEHFATQDWGDVNINTGVAEVQDLTIAGEAAGDILYFDGSNWVILAKDQDKYLKSGASAVSWDDPVFAGNWVVHFMDLDAASTAYVHAAITGTGGSQDITTEIINPDYGRNVTVTTTNNNSPSGNVTITGNLTDGTTAQTDVITVSPGGTASGVKAFVTVTNINVPAGIPAEDTVEIGIGDLMGIPNSINAESDIYNKTVDGVNEFDEISGNANTTNNTLDCATIAQNEDITISYHQ